MRVRALVSFSGVLTMHKGEVTEYGNEAVIRDLLKAGFIEEAETTKTGAASAKGKGGGKTGAGKRNNI